MVRVESRRGRWPLVTTLACCCFCATAVAQANPSSAAPPATDAPPATLHLGDVALPLVFQEDFESGRSRWETTDDKAWEVRDGGKPHGQVFALTRRNSGYEPPHRSPRNIALIRELELRDFAIIVDVRSPVDTGPHRDCCVFFTHRSPSDYYYVHLGAKPDPASGQIMIVADAPRRPLTQNTNAIPWRDGWHRVKVTRVAGTGAIAVYFDDMQTPVMQATDNTFEVGRLGIGSFDDMNEFDNVLIYGR